MRGSQTLKNGSIRFKKDLAIASSLLGSKEWVGMHVANLWVYTFVLFSALNLEESEGAGDMSISKVSYGNQVVTLTYSCLDEISSGKNNHNVKWVTTSILFCRRNLKTQWAMLLQRRPMKI